MLSPYQYGQLSPEGQRQYIQSLTISELIGFTAMLNKWLAKSAREADILSLFGSAPTTSNVRYNLTMLKRSKEDTIVDVIARYPQLKLCPAIMELVSEDFNQYLRPRHK